MYNIRTPKGQKPSKSAFCLHWPHREENYLNLTVLPYVQILSIDPGISNYAIRIERRHANRNIEKLYFQLWTLPKFDEDAQGINQTFVVLSQKLDSILELIRGCHIIVIERQLLPNYKSIRIMQHSLTYFMLMCRDTPLKTLIYDIAPATKNKYFNISHDVKKWSICKTIGLLIDRGEYDSLSLFLKKTKQQELIKQYRSERNIDIFLPHFRPGKKDDLADTVVQAEVTCLRLGLPGTFTPATLEIQSIEFNNNGTQLCSSNGAHMVITNDVVVQSQCANSSGAIAGDNGQIANNLIAINLNLDTKNLVQSLSQING